MKRREIPTGYIANFASHGEPAQSEPPPPIIEQKEAETLMGHCLKEFIKERLYGKLINYTKLANSNKTNFTPNIPAIEIPTSRRRHSEVRNHFSKRANTRFDSAVKTPTQRTLDKRNQGHSGSLERYEKSIYLQASRNRKVSSSFSIKNNQNQGSEHLKQPDIDRYKGSSFLSEIQAEDSKASQVKKHVKLSPLHKSGELNEKLEKIKAVMPSPNRLQFDKFVINSQFWDTVCRKPKKNELQFDGGLAKVLTTSPSIVSDFQHPTNVETNVSTLQNSMAVDKSKYFLAKPSFSKQMFLEYLNNSKHSVNTVANFLSNFFEVNGKIYDDMKMEDYRKAVQTITTAGNRVWGVCSFRFWNINKNGIITTNDIFRHFKEFDAIQTHLKQCYSDYQRLQGYKIIRILLNTLDTMRKLILERSLQVQLDRSIMTEQNLQKVVEIKYLQESLLKKKQIKYSDLGLILGQNINNVVNQTKRSVIQSAQQIGIKMSSCYRYSFLATDHNEQTRTDRDHIETLKESLRKQKIEIKESQNQNQLSKKKLEGIDYTTFLQAKLFKSMKDVAVLLFGVQLV